MPETELNKKFGRGNTRWNNSGAIVFEHILIGFLTLNSRDTKARLFNKF